MKTIFRLALVPLVLLLVTPARAQTYTAPKLNYGYQPYNDRNPTGFSHPNDMGYGHYVSGQKPKGVVSTACPTGVSEAIEPVLAGKTSRRAEPAVSG